MSHLWLPQAGVLPVQHNLAALADFLPGTSVPTHATVNSTKGTETTLIASTNFDAFELWVYISNYASSGASSKGMVDILIGSATADIAIANLLSGQAGGDGTACPSGKAWKFPLYIPSGARISAQAAGERTGVSLRVAVWIRGGPYPPGRVGTKVTTYGVGTVPDATAVTAGNDAEGNWTEITASTTSDHFACVPSFQGPTDTSYTPKKGHSVDIGIGSATEELLGGYEQGYLYSYDTVEACDQLGFADPIYADIPSGSRLVARICASGAADAAAPQIALHCVSE